jgi:four helix bundle protein
MNNSLDNLEVYTLAHEIGSLAWKIYNQLDRNFQFHIGNQFLDAADSISANIAEGYGRYHFKEVINFNNYARGSAYETIDWIRKLKARELTEETELNQIMEMLNIEIQKINGYNRYLRNKNREK